MTYLSTGWQVILFIGLNASSALAQDAKSDKKSPTAQALMERHAKEKSPVWADGDMATFFFRGEAEEVTLAIGGETKKLRRLPDSDVWTLTVQRPGLQK